MSTSFLPLVAFVVVVAMIPLALRAMKRAGVGGGAAGGVLKSVAHLGLGTTQRVSVVELTVGAQRHWLVLGVTGEQVANLATFPAPDVPVTPPPAMPAHTVTVQQLIARWRGVQGGGERTGGDDGNGRTL